MSTYNEFKNDRGSGWLHQLLVFPAPDLLRSEARAVVQLLHRLVVVPQPLRSCRHTKSNKYVQ